MSEDARIELAKAALRRAVAWADNQVGPLRDAVESRWAGEAREALETLDTPEEVVQPEEADETLDEPEEALGEPADAE